ncbi:hypothetical protein AAVH_32578, partial [Aphelenchoides avenae]
EREAVLKKLRELAKSLEEANKMGKLYTIEPVRAPILAAKYDVLRPITSRAHRSVSSFTPLAGAHSRR